MRVSLIALLLALFGAGCAGSARAPDEAATGEREAGTTVVQADAGQSVLEVLRGRHPALRIRDSSRGLVITMRRSGEAPVFIIDGLRRLSSDGRLELRAEEVAKVEVLTSLSETLIYGSEAGRRGVVRITTRLKSDSQKGSE